MVLALLIRRYQSDQMYSSLPRKVDHELDTVKNTLRLTSILGNAFPNGIWGQSVSHWALSNPAMLYNLQNAMMGNYQCVLHLTSALTNGASSKQILDNAIQKCGSLTHICEAILHWRIQYFTSQNSEDLSKAVGSLYRYMFLLSFCSYLEERNLQMPFSNWLTSRPEVWNMLKMTRNTSPTLSIFKPIDDLTNMHKTNSLSSIENLSETESFKIRTRKGEVLGPYSIIKEDFWTKNSVSTIKGASNFRKIASLPIYGVAQPTLQGMKNLIWSIGDYRTIYWINLREEPLIYLNGTPYVLRDEFLTIRNTKFFSGIKSSRLELVEAKLKQDILSELNEYNGQILLHSENEHGEVKSMTEECSNEAVLTLAETKAVLERELNMFGILKYHRVPFTSQSAPDPSDFDKIIEILHNVDILNSAIILNCQIGIGRSTFGMIIAYLIFNWRHKSQLATDTAKKRLTFQVIHSLLRVIRNGIACKSIVDDAIDECGAMMNLRDKIKELYGYRSEESMEHGSILLTKYFYLILFQSFLDQGLIGKTSFQNWIKSHPEFETIREQSMSSVNPLCPIEIPGESVLICQVQSVVNGREGSVLGPGMIIKSDYFPGMQKLKPCNSQLSGLKNFRRINSTDYPYPAPLSNYWIGGVGMPSRDAINSLLKETSLKVYWTSLREEPVVYVKGRPFVLRPLEDPLKNLETTGISRSDVELMEKQFKLDVLAEIKRCNNQLLLHEERLDGSKFELVPVWETISEGDIQTPLEVYQTIQSSGGNVDYWRIPMYLRLI
jgi:protein-tyrosine phosphatase